MCKYVVIEMELTWSQVEIALQEDVELQSELRHALDVQIDEHGNVEMPSQFNVKFIVAYVEVRESRIFKSTFVSQLNGNPTLSKYRLTWIRASTLYVKPKLLTTMNHDIILNLGCDCGVCFLNTSKARIVTNVVNQKN